MSRSLESRLRKLEHGAADSRLTHEDWVELLEHEPPRTPAENAALDAAITAQAIAECGSHRAAASAAWAKAKRTGDSTDEFLAWDLEIRANDTEAGEGVSGGRRR